ncbi:MAG TPA: hypothetical protein PKZ32_15990 [Candidatus Melainabacteria bacterium]|jgi:hypothetical protein|nr:hypothetical protein [Candidatus Melainabacteria bacterium]
MNNVILRILIPEAGLIFTAAELKDQILLFISLDSPRISLCRSIFMEQNYMIPLKVKLERIVCTRQLELTEVT